MDKCTHEVRLAQWTRIIQQCQNRSQGQPACQWFKENGINSKSYYYWLRKIRRNTYNQATVALLDSISDRLLARILQEVSHA